MANLTAEWTFGVTPIFLTLYWDTEGVLEKQVNGGGWTQIPEDSPFKDENVNSSDTFSYRVTSGGEVISNTVTTSLKPTSTPKGKGRNK